MPLQATSGAASYDAFGGGVPVVPNYIEDVFSTWLYTGNGSSQTITNGIDLSGKGGLVWFKRRSTAISHALFDSARSSTSNALFTNTSGAQVSSYGVTFNSNGVSLGQSEPEHNSNGETYVSWTFRKQPKFFDVVTYTGNGSNRTIAHALGSVPGCIIVKRTNTTGDWMIYHRSIANTQYYNFAYTGTPATDSTVWNSTTATSSVFSLGTNSNVNASGSTYVAYVFAHDAGGFGLTGTDNVITCGSFTTDGSGNATVNLGYEPQFVMLQRQDDGWFMNDSMRGMPAPPSGSGTNANLFPDSSNAESINGRDTSPTSTGFVARMGSASKFCIYIAIRRGPMKVPTDGTKVYGAVSRAGTGANATVTTGSFPPDLTIIRGRDAGFSWRWGDRLRGTPVVLRSNLVNAELTGEADLSSFNMDGFSLTGTGASLSNSSGANYINYAMGRAPGFFDEVCYSGTGAVGNAVSHNLGVAPELMIIKGRAGTVGANDWQTLANISSSGYIKLFLNKTDAALGPYNYAINAGLAAQPTSTNFTVNNVANFNNGSTTYVAYLFATCPGVSKVGTYTGNGTTQTINCGFGAGGARFVLIKQTDTTGGWYVYDTARGMTVLTDPYLFLNSTAAETATLGSVTTVSTGFALNSAILADINVSAGTYIFLAIA